MLWYCTKNLFFSFITNIPSMNSDIFNLKDIFEEFWKSSSYLFERVLIRKSSESRLLTYEFIHSTTFFLFFILATKYFSFFWHLPQQFLYLSYLLQHAFLYTYIFSTAFLYRIYACHNILFTFHRTKKSTFHTLIQNLDEKNGHEIWADNNLMAIYTMKMIPKKLIS